MSDLLPVRLASPDEYRQLARATRARERTELEIYNHELLARREAECELADSNALTDVVRHALVEETSLLQDGLQMAGDSLAARELVAKKLSLLSRTNDQRINRRFG